MQVAIDSGIPKIFGIADDGMEVAFRGRDKVCVIHQYSSGKGVPAPYAVVNKRPGKCYPSRTCCKKQTRLAIATIIDS